MKPGDTVTISLPDNSFKRVQLVKDNVHVEFSSKGISGTIISLSGVERLWIDIVGRGERRIYIFYEKDGKNSSIETSNFVVSGSITIRASQSDLAIDAGNIRKIVKSSK